MTVINLIIVALLGLVLGSFLGALTYRVPREVSFIAGRSFCDSCKKKLEWYFNIPIFSYLFLGGKSGCCGKRISLRYPVIEGVASIAAVFLFLQFPFPLFIIHYSLFLVSLAILVIDWENQIILDELSFLFFILALIISHQSLVIALFSGFLYSSSLMLIHIVTSGRGMGLGDVKLAIGMGAAIGLYKGLLWLFVSFLTGGIVASILLLSGKAKLKQKIAFGPFMIIGFWISYLFL